MIYDMLYDWQKNIVDKILPKRSYGLFLDCGLGKTPQALALAEKHNCTKLLIVTLNSKALETTSTSGSWHQWMTRYADGSFNIWTKKSNPSEFTRASKGALIINYEALFDRKVKSGVALNDFVQMFIESAANQSAALIIDESHKLKDPTSTQTKALEKIHLQFNLYSNELFVYLLTGTPFTTGYIDLFSQLRYLGCPMKKQEFKDRFCVLGNIKGLLGWQQPIVGYKNLDQLYNLVHNYAVTVKSDDVLQLPPKIFQNHICPSTREFIYLTKEKLTGKEILAFCKVRAEKGLPLPPETYVPYQVGNQFLNPWYRNINYPDNAFLADTPALLWMRARQLSIGFQGNTDRCVWFDKSRIAILEKFLTDHPDNYLIFYNYTPEFVELYDLCASLGYNIDVFNGPIKSMTFYNAYAEQTPAQRLGNRKNVILANFASGSTGMNWQLYNHCIMFSIPLYKDFEQGHKRVHRTGSTDAVIYHIFSGDNWLDRGMYKALEAQQDYSEAMFKQDARNAGLQFDSNII